AREAVRITIIPLYAIFVVPLVAVVYAMTIVLAQIVYYLAAVVTAAIELVLISIFSPIFLIAELLGDTVVHIRFTSLITIFGVLPDPPLVILF
ncbi:MAG: hypothetical protein HZB38_06965, partial [Planctomycetes bacterium]|nr:hypothetical protein [Planctomycetota bacterium]